MMLGVHPPLVPSVVRHPGVRGQRGGGGGLDVMVVARNAKLIVPTGC